jgi:hypothetical protein
MYGELELDNNAVFQSFIYIVGERVQMTEN